MPAYKGIQGSLNGAWLMLQVDTDDKNNSIFTLKIKNGESPTEEKVEMIEEDVDELIEALQKAKKGNFTDGINWERIHKTAIRLEKMGR
ncbi:MAG: hypothetical protein Q8N68_03540 [bacterium]|nr:hypothetical protein [bacterium]